MTPSRYVQFAATLLALLVAHAAVPFAGAQEKGAAPPQTIRVLFVGNSQIFFNDLPRLIEALSESAPADRPRIQAGRALAGGASLAKHRNRGTDQGTARAKIAEEKWDYVVLQDIYNVKPESFNEHARLFHELIREHGAQSLLFSTANVSSLYPKGFLDLHDMNVALGKELNVPVAAAGKAWLTYWGKNPSPEQRLALYDPDKGHPGKKGSYIYACTLYAALTGLSPIGLTHRVPDQPEDTVTAAEAKAFQEAAWRVHQEINGKPGNDPSQTADGAITKNIEYGRAGDKPLLLDLYRPQNSGGSLPIVMWVHGGGWNKGSKDRCPATWLTDHGYAVASINYRLTDEAQWPAQIDDCRTAVRWLRSHADEYGLDGSQVAAWGGSAGGHLVALLGTLDAPGNETVSSRVQAVCDWYGPSDLLTMPPNVLSPGKTEADLANSNGAKLLGGVVRDRPELARQASAIFQVSADDPPFLIMHGDKDPGVPLDQSQRLHDKLKVAGVSSTLKVIEGAGHGGKEFQTPEVRQIILEFFNRHLRVTQ